jgi:ribosome-binding factor A
VSDNRRVHRVEKEVHHLVSSYILSNIQGELHGLVSVNRVVMTRDLRNAKVYVSAFGEGANIEANLPLIQSRAGEIQAYINQQLRMKFCPKLTFYVDEMTDRLARIERELSLLHSKVDQDSVVGKETSESSAPQEGESR